jgi:hypothetical protein
MAYLYLALAIIAEVAATSALKASEEFSPKHNCNCRVLRRFLFANSRSESNPYRHNLRYLVWSWHRIGNHRRCFLI